MPEIHFRTELNQESLSAYLYPESDEEHRKQKAVGQRAQASSHRSIQTPREKITASSIAIPHHDRFGNDPLSHALGDPLG
ncbi:MAG: hypothetical protein P1U77_21160 [Rubripirellula sp.]|nr:hypothetical protein [Rubripirellula sp.]